MATGMISRLHTFYFAIRRVVTGKRQCIFNKYRPDFTARGFRAPAISLPSNGQIYSADERFRYIVSPPITE